MRATLSDESAPVLQEPSPESISITSLKKGEEFELGKVTRKKKEAWVAVTLQNGATGYINGSTRIFQVQKVEAIGNPIEVHEAPDDDSPILKTIPKKTPFTLCGFEKVEIEDSGDAEEGKEGEEAPKVKKGGDWLIMYDADIKKGYFRAGHKLRAVAEYTAASARKLMITGGIFTAIGIVAYFVINATAANDGSGNSSFLALALMLLGLFQLGQGYMQWRKVKKDAAK